MTVSLTHAYVSAIADSGDTSLIQPSNWNAQHTMSMAAGNLLGRATGAGTGAVSEIPIGVDAAGHVTLPAGTASAAPLTLTSGTKLTTATAGSIEYDGTVMYATPLGTQRGLIPNEQIYVLQNFRAHVQSSSATSLFGYGCSVSSNTVYKFEVLMIFTSGISATANAINFGFGGTSTVNYCYYYSVGLNQSGSIPIVDTTPENAISISASQTPISSSYGASTTARAFLITGIINITTGGTLIPQYSMSNSTPDYSLYPGTYMRIFPVGTGTSDIAIGSWA
jgi:hypothetical protein